jgi:hypothetical protein
MKQYPWITKEQFNEIVSKHPLTWSQLNRLVRRANMRTEDLFDTETSREPGSSGTSDRSEFEQSQVELTNVLRRLHLLRIPVHYRVDGKLYLVREECQHVLFPQDAEDALDKLNVQYEKMVATRKNSKARETEERQYHLLLEAAKRHNVPFFFSSIVERFQFVDDTDGMLLSMI